MFDHSVVQNEEASVALYSLGSPELLALATAEAVGVLDAWGVLGPDRDALEIGCGIGRFLAPLASRLRSVVGIDISENMIQAASRRLGSKTNVQVSSTSGRDLTDFPDGCFDLVYSIDTFPYLVQAGPRLVETHFREVARVLRASGDFVLFNYAYGQTREQSAREVRALATKVSYCVERLDESPFGLWNGIGFHLKRR
jgi:cyclopropane fatty-acyl-phospholipid synthase-like methyltransferase